MVLASIVIHSKDISLSPSCQCLAYKQSTARNTVKSESTNNLTLRSSLEIYSVSISVHKLDDSCANAIKIRRFGSFFRQGSSVYIYICIAGNKHAALFYEKDRNLLSVAVRKQKWRHHTPQPRLFVLASIFPRGWDAMQGLSNITGLRCVCPEHDAFHCHCYDQPCGEECRRGEEGVYFFCRTSLNKHQLLQPYCNIQ